MELYNKEFVYFEWDDKLEGKEGFLSDSIGYLKEDVKEDVKDNRRTRFGEIHKHNGNNYPFASEKGICYTFCYYDPYYEFRKAYIEGKQLQYKDRDSGDWIDVDGIPLFTTDEYRIKPEWYIVLDEYGLSRTTEPSENETVLFEGTEEECIQWLDEHKKFENIMLAWKQGKTIETMGLDSYWHKVVTPHWHTDNSYRVVDECKGCMKYKDCNSDGIRCRNYCVKVEYVPFDTVEGLIEAWDNKYPQNKNRPEGTMPLIWIKNKQKNRVYLITDFLFDKYHNNDVGTEYENLQLKELFEDFTFLDGSVIGKVKEE